MIRFKVFLFGLLVALSCHSQIPTKKFHSVWLFQAGIHQLKDVGFNEKYTEKSIPYNSKYYYITNEMLLPFGQVGVKLDSIKFGDLNFTWNHLVGVQWSDQDYNIDRWHDTINDKGKIEQINSGYSTNFRKTYLTYQTQLDFWFHKKFFFSPIVQLDYHLKSGVPNGNAYESLSWYGVYDQATNTFINQPKFLLKFGWQVGVKIYDDFDVVLFYMNSLNKSIPTMPYQNWHNVQYGLCLRYSFLPLPKNEEIDGNSYPIDQI
ncbi:MAG: hypothetical protein R3A43_04810 [Bacteroidia bacterium]